MKGGIVRAGNMSGEYVRIPSLEYASVSAGCFDANITSVVAYYSRSANWTAMIEPLTVPNECQTTPITRNTH